MVSTKSLQLLKNNPKLIIGIQCTAWCFGIAVLNKNKKVLYQIHNKVIPIEGLHDKECRDSHMIFIKNYRAEIFSNLNKYNTKIEKIIVSTGPGFFSCLKLGNDLAKDIANTFNVEIYGVHHALGHLSAVEYLSKSRIKNGDLILYFSGGHTHWFIFYDNAFKTLYQTSDLALGNFFDKLGRIFNLSHPGGPKLEKIYFQNKRLFPNYQSELHSGLNNNFNLNGLLTYYKNSKKSFKFVITDMFDTVFTKILTVTHTFVFNYAANAVWVIGGVAQNKILKNYLNLLNRNYDGEIINKAILKRGVKMKTDALNSDNAVSIALSHFFHKENLELVLDIDSLKTLKRTEYSPRKSYPSESQISKSKNKIKKTFFKAKSIDNNMEKKIKKEYKILKYLDNLKKSFITPKPLKLGENYIIMSRLYAKTLQEVLLENSESKLEIISLVLANIANLHNLGLIHNDLNLQNILYKEKTVYFLDFTKSIFSKKSSDKLEDILKFKNIINFDINSYLKFFKGKASMAKMLISMKRYH